MSHPSLHSEKLPDLGLGLRLRKEYIPQILEDEAPIDWFEIISECYLDASEEKLRELDQVRERHPIVMHGISMGIGSPWPIDTQYLEQIKKLVDRVKPVWISDHLCWGGADDVQGQLLPLPYSYEMIEHVIPRILQVQNYLGCHMLLENVPSEEIDPKTEMPEADFVREVAVSANSLILLDIENLHTTSMNQGIDPMNYLNQLPIERVQQIHLAGATALCEPDDDEESDTAQDPVWKLYLEALNLFGPTSTMIERLDTIPPFSEMVCEVKKARCALSRLFPDSYSS